MDQPRGSTIVTVDNLRDHLRMLSELFSTLKPSLHSGPSAVEAAENNIRSNLDNLDKLTQGLTPQELAEIDFEIGLRYGDLLALRHIGGKEMER